MNYRVASKPKTVNVFVKHMYVILFSMLQLINTSLILFNHLLNRSFSYTIRVRPKRLDLFVNLDVFRQMMYTN